MPSPNMLLVPLTLAHVPDTPTRTQRSMKHVACEVCGVRWEGRLLCEEPIGVCVLQLQTKDTAPEAEMIRCG